MNLKPVIIDTARTFRKSMLWFYSIYIAIMLALSVIFIHRSNSTSGTEMATMIFLVVTGLTIFRPSFVLYCSTGISRRTMLTGMLAVFPVVCLAASILDTALNRLFNLFHPNASNYEMLFGTLKIHNSLFSYSSSYHPPMDIGSLAAATLWQAAVYFGVLSLAFFLAVLFYRLGKFGRVLLCMSPVILFFSLFSTLQPLISFWRWFFGGITQLLFGNPVSSSLSFLVLGLVSFVLCWPVIRRLGVKRT